MPIFTRQEFETTATSLSGSQRVTANLNERRFTKAAATTSIFLSHSHLDRSTVAYAKAFFESLGMSIYVDWADQTMPEKTDAITAQKIKNQIISLNDKFILLATNNAVCSRWCNWEIGIADTFKLSTQKIALLPLADNSGNWVGNEYLSIYPRIEKSLLNDRLYYVINPDSTREDLKSWLKK